MSSAGGGGVSLPPIVQPIQISMNGNGAATGMFGRIMSGASGASGALGGVGASAMSMNQAVMRTLPTWRTAGDAMRQAGSLMMYTVAMPLINIGKSALQAAEEFETAMTKIKGLVGIPSGEVDKMGESLLKMAGEVGKSPVELAEALFFVTSAGQRGAQALDTLEVSAKAAAAGLGTTKTVADLVTSVMNAYPDGLYDAAHATDILVTAVREGKASAADFAPAMGKVLPIAASFGLTFQDVAASVAALTRQGTAAGTATIQLRQILASVLKPTAEAKDELAKYGLSMSSLRETIQTEGLFAGFERLHAALGDNAEAMTRVFGNVRPLTAIQALLGPSMSKNADIFNEMSAAAGNTDVAFKEVQKTSAQKWAETSAAMKASLIEMGNSLAPVSKSLAGFGKILAFAFGGLAKIPGLTKIVAGFAGMAIAVSIATRTMSTWIRMQYLSTIALQGLTGGMRNTQNQTVTNILTGKQYSYAQQQQIATTNAQRAATVNSLSPMQAMAMTMEEMSATMTQLMQVMTENSIITAESSNFSRQLAEAQGYVVSSSTTMTDAILAGDTALSKFDATVATTATAVSSTAGATAEYTAALDAIMIATAGDADATATMIAIFDQFTASVMAATGGLTDAGSLMAADADIAIAYSDALDAVMIATDGDAAAMTALTDALYMYNQAIAAAAAGTAIDAAVTEEAVVTNVAMEQSLWQKVVAAAADKQGMAMGAVATTFFGQAQLVAGAAVGVLGAQLKSMMASMGPLLLISIGLGLVMHKMMGGGAKEAAKQTNDASSALRKLSDTRSKMNFKPLIVGVNVVYSYSNSKGGSGGKINPANLIKDVIFDGKLPKDFSSDQKLIVKEIQDAIARSTTNQQKLDFAAAWASSFADPATRDSAVAYMAQKFNIPATDIAAAVDSVVTDASKFVQLQFKRQSKGVSMNKFVLDIANMEIDTSRGDDANPNYKPAKEIAGRTAKEMQAVLDRTPALTLPFQDAVTGGSTEQMVAALSGVWHATEKATGSVVEADKATVAYAQSAFKAAGGTANSNTMFGLLQENAALLDGNITDLTAKYETQTGKTKAATATAREFIHSLKQMEAQTQNTGQATNDMADWTSSLQAAFAQGLNPEIQNASDLMDAYNEALKGVKKGQDALYGSQFDAVEAGVKANQAIWSAMDAIKESGGKWQGTTEAADDLKSNLVDVAKSILDVGNAAYANGEGGADVAAVRAANASTEAYKRAVRNMLKAGMDQKDIDEFFNSVLGKNIDISTGKITFDPKTFTQTFSTDLGAAFTNVENGITNTTQGIGTNALTGIVEGIDKNSGLVGDAAKNAMKAMITTLKEYLQIKSPSKLLANVIGAPMAMGIAQGLQDKTPAAIKAIEDHIKAVEKAGEQAAGSKGSTTTGTTIAPQVPVVVPNTVTKSGMSVGQIYSQGIADGVVSSQGVVAQAFTGTIYDVTTKYMDHTAGYARKAGQAWTEKWAEGILNGKSDASTSIVDLIQAVMQEVSDNLSTTTTTISAILDLSGARRDLDKFKNSNSDAMLTAGLNRANREAANATAKFGGNQGTEVTRYERAQIADSRKSAQQAQRDYALGKISYSQLLDAQQAYAGANAAASEASSEVVDAQNNVLDAQYQQKNGATLLAQEQMKVVTAQQALNTAYVNARINGDDATTALTNLGAQAAISTTAINNIVTGLANIPGANMGLGTGLNTLIKPAAAQNKASKVTRVKGKKQSTSGGSGGSGGNKHTGSLAKGGPLFPGQLTLVGESGPELITPNAAGTVTPYSVLERYARTAAHNSQSGEYGGSGNNINITVNNPTPEPASDSIARRMQNMSALGLFA